MNAYPNDNGVNERAKLWTGRLRHCADDPAGIVLGLPNGGFATALVISGLLRIPAHVFIAQNLRAPCGCPCTIGALTETSVVHMDQSVIARQQWPYRELRAYIEQEMQAQREEIARQRQFLRAGQALPDLTGRHVLFVDDGTSTPATLIASIESFRRLGAELIVAAIPTDSFQIIREIEPRVDELIVRMPSGLVSGEDRIGRSSPVRPSRVA